MCCLQNFLHDFPKVGFSNSMSLSAKAIVVCFSVFCVISATACLSDSIYTSGL